MSAETNQQEVSLVAAEQPFTGLEGVEALVNSPALQILRERGHLAEFPALVTLARIVDEHETRVAAAA